MSCDRVSEALNAWLDGEVGLLAAARIRRHLRRCAACAEYARAAQAISRAARSWRGEGPPRALESRMAAALDSAPAALLDQAEALFAGTPSPVRPAARPRGRRLAAMAGIVAAGAAAATAVVFLTPPAPEGSSRTPPQVAAALPAPSIASASLPETASGGREEHPDASGDPQPQHRSAQRWVRPTLGGYSRAKTPPLEDTAYLDGRDSDLRQFWVDAGRGAAGLIGEIERQLITPKDDFVRLPAPRLADSAAGGAALKDAVDQYNREASVVDTRLSRRVTLQLKAASLEELCAALQVQAAVRLHAGRGVADEKVTVLVKDLPARDVMRGVARLFGYYWGRNGEGGSYSYELVQDLRSRLVEEELRNSDANAALLALDAEMERYRPLLGLTPEQLRSRVAAASGPEKARLQGLLEHGGWGGLQAYSRLSPAERLALRSGEEIRFSLDAENPDRRLPAVWKRPLLQSWNQKVSLGTTNGELFWNGTTPVADVPGAVPVVTLRMNRSEAGQLNLQAGLNVTIQASEMEWKSRGTAMSLAVGRSPSVAKPDNGAANAALKGRPPFNRVISLAPKPAYRTRADYEAGRDKDFTGVTSAEVWEALHHESGLNVIADFYTRLHPHTAFRMERVSLFDALCRAGETLGVRWKKDGDALLCRSTGYFWDKVKEVPKRQLVRWQQAARPPDGLPLQDLLEMGMLSDAQLDSLVVAEGVVYGWGIEEYALVTPPGRLRSQVRFVAALAPEQRRKLFSPEALLFGDLNFAQQQEFLRMNPWVHDPNLQLRPELLAQTRLNALYAPAGVYWWAPRDPNGSLQVRDVMLTDRSAEKLLEAARRIDAAAGPHQIQRSEGDLLLHGRIGDLLKFGRSRTHAFVNLIGPR
jgi:hypothetical protein